MVHLDGRESVLPFQGTTDAAGTATVSSASNFECTQLLTECMPILLAEEVQKRLPNLCGSPTIILLTVGQAHIVRVECSFGVGVEISDEIFLSHEALELSRVV